MSSRGLGCECAEPCSCIDCKCGSGTSAGETITHTYCKCGEHCSCNPCECSKSDEAVAGKSYCKCGESCSCESCSCARAELA